ncbi:MAG: DNA mismatch repair endonuclease MutL [Crocinitomicaceae bacterium]|nr:MAG: DNA mismatch repair endonuclease MutL [Crocinitomicaceae bacterium]
MSEVIRLLPDHIANQIAAGEVIQRPASVVKELVENAIDAGATHVDVVIKDAGKTLIQVLDNGSGMSEMDARMAFERHATSKLRVAEDLFDLHTKGFRGEALASIAAIAHVSLKTKMQDADWGTDILIEGSKVIDQTPITCKTGSSFEVKNLFFNVPARRNFLKSDAVEFKHIEDEFLRIVLVHPSIAFTLIHNGSTIYNLPVANHRKRIVDVFGKAYNDKLVPIDEQTGIVRISGFIGKPEFAKKSRGEQFLFVNDRFFKDSYFNHAITQAYDTLLVSKTFPAYFLYLTVNPGSIDVNVHPTKTEIKFEDDKEIYAILRSAVKQSLGKFNIAPVLDFEQETSFDLPWEMKNQPVVAPTIQVDPTYNPFKTSAASSSSSGIKSDKSKAISNAGFGQLQAQKSDWENFYQIDEVQPEQQQGAIELDSESDTKKQFIFQSPYLFCPIKSGIMVIHSKRAQERIIYDEIMQTFMVHPIHSQQLLFPLEIDASESQKMLWDENRKTLERLGFVWSNQPAGIQIAGAPAHLKEEGIVEAVHTIHSNLEQNEIDKGEIAHAMISSIAAAATSHVKNWNDESANQLIEHLFMCTDHQYSPRGKVILNTITASEINLKF